MSPEEQRGVTNTKQSLCLILQIIHSVILQTSVSKVSADQYEAVLLLTYRCMILRSISELSWAGGGDRRSQLWLHSALLSSSPPPVSPSSSHSHILPLQTRPVTLSRDNAVMHLKCKSIPSPDILVIVISSYGYLML